jgi:hypothetical protein
MRNVLFASAIGLALVAGSVTIAPSAVHAQPAATASQASVPTGELALGSVTLGRDVMADGKPLKAGTYRLRLTPENATPPAKGQTPEFERWVEFLRGGKVVGREVVSIVPRSEIKDVAEDAAPASGAAKVQMLKGNEYVRIWVNRGGNHYLIHLPTTGGARS